MLAYYMEKNLPAFQVTVIFKNEDNWTGFVEQVFQTNGWATRLAHDKSSKTKQSLTQMIWYSSGELIGNAAGADGRQCQ